MTWRYLAYDLVTETFITELSVASWSSTDELNDAGTFDAVVVLDDTPATLTVQAATALLDDDSETLTDDDSATLLGDVEPTTITPTRNTTTIQASTPGKTLIVAERDGVPVFAGIPWKRRYEAATRSFRIAGAGLGSFFDHLKPANDYTPTGVDQLTIFSTLAARGAEIGIVTHGETSGRTRDRSYLRLANKKPGELMRELAAVIDGFDFDYRVEYVADAPVRTQRLYYPRRGRSIATSTTRFRIPGNASLTAVDEDATRIATEVIGFGAGDGVDLIESVASSTDLTAAGYPAYGATVSYKDVSVQETLDQNTAAELRDRSVVDKEVFALEVDPNDRGQPYGSWELGSDAYVIIEDDPRFPAQDDGSPGLVAARRIVSHSWQVTGSGEELQVGLDLIAAVRRTARTGAGIDPDIDRRLRSLEGVQ